MTNDTLKTFRLPSDTMTAISRRAAKEEVSASEVLRRAVDTYLAQPVPRKRSDAKRKRGGLKRKM